jgi:uncharacterized protein (TIGR03435 family)
MLLTQAYAVKSYQITGPATLDSEHFDITVKVPAGADKAQFDTMMQNLLKDRFKMTIHREKKELPAYSMVIAKSGLKMKVSAPVDPATVTDKPLALPLGAPKIGKDGFPELPSGMPAGRLMMMMMPGRAMMKGTGISIGDLAQRLEQQLDKAVVDSTGLTDKYDVAITFEPDMNRMMAGMPMGMGRGPGGPGDGGPAPPPDGEAAPNIFTAVQEQLGLKLEPKKISADLVVIDRLDKTPTEN